MTREEAIRRIKAWNLDSDDREVLAVIIPELAESEDERIRKQLIDAIKIGRSNSGISFTEEAASRYIAWLEKQKDIEDRWIEDRGQCFWDGVEEGKMLAEKQKEQKPAKWSEEDDQYLLVCKNALSKYERSDGWDAFIISTWLEKRLKSLRPSWKPSEKQMEALNALNLHGDLSYVGQQNQLISLYQDLKKL